jgi:hypothetical protein
MAQQDLQRGNGFSALQKLLFRLPQSEFNLVSAGFIAQVVGHFAPARKLTFADDFLAFETFGNAHAAFAPSWGLVQL